MLERELTRIGTEKGKSTFKVWGYTDYSREEGGFCFQFDQTEWRNCIDQKELNGGFRM